MGKKKSQRKTTAKPPIRKTRKELRKEQRKEKKLNRSMRYHGQQTQTRPLSSPLERVKDKKTLPIGSSEPKKHPVSNIEMDRKQEKSKQKKLESEMQENRRKQLLAANVDEDRTIRHLEKLLHLNRRKSKSIPKSFADDGLSYLIEVCDPDAMKDSVKADQVLEDSGSEFEEDFALVRGTEKEKRVNKSKTSNKRHEKHTDDQEDSGSDPMSSDGGPPLEDGSEEEMSDIGSGSDLGLGVDDDSDEEMMHGIDGNTSVDEEEGDVSAENDMSAAEDESESQDSEEGSLPDSGDEKNSGTSDESDAEETFIQETQVAPGNIDDDNGKSTECDDTDSGDVNDSHTTISTKTEPKRNPDGTWEDIYGRMRGKDGKVIDIQSKPGKYIPPALRAKLQGDEDAKRKESLARLKKQMKGLINRLAENNMTNICNQIDELFMKNSRNDMNETLLSIFTDALVSPVLTPERLVMEHMLLIAVLHANVGTEVGAHFLQNMMKKFQEMLDQSPDVENKEIDNVILIISHLYNFKVFSASLMYEVLHKIAKSLDEKRIELLLVVLRNVGFSLRKDDPLALKSLILKLQGNAMNSASSTSNSSRVKFMLDILMAIKNNNVSKIPSYNPEHSEHLKKLLRSLVRRGNYVAELKISLDDLLKAEERGRWWIVGSAWTGHLPGENPAANPSSQSIDSLKHLKTSEPSYNTQLLELARKQRMNTGVRKDIFCILMTAEDYLDAFEKLLHLNLKNQQRQEIVHVLFDCCLQEKSFNLYYAHLSQKFCDFDRQYQMKFQYCLWDKLRDLSKFQNTQISNMAKLLGHLFLEKGLPISALKVMSFAEMDKPCIRLVRQILLIILLSEDSAKCDAVFRRIAPSPQLHLFREGLRLFISHFVIRKSNSKSLPKHELELLGKRAKLADKALSSADSRMEF